MLLLLLLLLTLLTDTFTSTDPYNSLPLLLLLPLPLPLPLPCSGGQESSATTDCHQRRTSYLRCGALHQLHCTLQCITLNIVLPTVRQCTAHYYTLAAHYTTHCYTLGSHYTTHCSTGKCGRQCESRAPPCRAGRGAASGALAAHYTLYTAHYTLYTAHYTLYTAQYTVDCILYIVIRCTVV